MIDFLGDDFRRPFPIDCPPLELEGRRGVGKQRRSAEKVDFTGILDDQFQIMSGIMIVWPPGFIIPADLSRHRIVDRNKALNDPCRIEKGVDIVACPVTEIDCERSAPPNVQRGPRPSTVEAESIARNVNRISICHWDGSHFPDPSRIFKILIDIPELDCL